MDAELRFHLDSQINDYVQLGFSREEATLRARREFGARGWKISPSHCWMRPQRPPSADPRAELGLAGSTIAVIRRR